MPRSPRSSVTRWNGVPLGTRSQSPSAAIGSGALSSRHASVASAAAAAPTIRRAASAMRIPLRMACVEMRHEAFRRRSEREAVVVDPRDGPYPEQRIRYEHFVGQAQLVGRKVALCGSNAERPRSFEHVAAHDTFDSAAREARRGDFRTRDDEDVASCTADHIAAGVEQETLLHGMPAKLELRQHLLEAAQVLDTGESRILTKPHPARAHVDPIAIIRFGIIRPRRDRQHARRRRRIWRRITAHAGTARHDELDDGPALLRAMRLDLLRKQAAGRSGYLEPPAALFEPIEMQVEPAD